MNYKSVLSLMCISIFLLSSCNTYSWQRKRYYNQQQSKNWNNYHQKKSEKHVSDNTKSDAEDEKTK